MVNTSILSILIGCVAAAVVVGGGWKVGSGEYTWGKTGRKNRKKPEKMSDSTS